MLVAIIEPYVELWQVIHGTLRIDRRELPIIHLRVKCLNYSLLVPDDRLLLSTLEHVLRTQDIFIFSDLDNEGAVDGESESDRLQLVFII